MIVHLFLFDFNLYFFILCGAEFATLLCYEDKDGSKKEQVLKFP